MSTPRRLGVLGGMGPLATADFLEKIIRATPAEHDRDHLPVVVYSVPQIPDRVGPIVDGHGESPLPAMIEGIRTLEGAGAEYIAIPCITAHYWYDELASAARIPIIHIADATCSALSERGVAKDTIGLLATAATMQVRFFRAHLEDHGYSVTEPGPSDMQEFVLPAISCVKRGEMAAAGEFVSRAVKKLLGRGVETAVLACSELPAALRYGDSDLERSCVDAVKALAQASVAHGFGHTVTGSLRP